jgi:potassium uptake TrkH family protein
VLFVTKFIVLARFVFEWWEPRKWLAHFYSLAIVVLIFYLHRQVGVVRELVPENEGLFLSRKLILYAGITFIFLTEISHVLRFIYRRSLNPAFVFIGSFAIIIIGGALLLLLPNATVYGISPVNAIFTSASAVCVTGLTVVDTATQFTLMGKIILLALFQIGGLGVMTFTALLGYVAAGSVSFQSQLALKDMLYSNRMNNVIQLIIRIFIVTFFFEVIGIFLIRSSINPDLFSSESQRIFFSIFHAVSAFCNAGFSTLSEGLYDQAFRFNYSLQMTIALLIILGGLGFPIVFNIFTYVRIKVQNFFRRLLKNPKQESYVRVLNVTSKLAMGTTAILLFVGFILFMIFEWDSTLLEHQTWLGKTVTSFFGSVTPRTAGFNTVPTHRLSLPTVMIFLLLMWIGASPGSTGGGIKTTTAAVAFLNLVSIIRGKDRTEVYKTEVSEPSKNKAFATMLISLLVIGLCVFLIAINDRDKELIAIAFEAFSAFSTVGLTMGITPDLSDLSKFVLVVVMFVGRVGAITVMVAFISQSKQLYYRYPKEDIIF